MYGGERRARTWPFRFVQGHRRGNTYRSGTTLASRLRKQENSPLWSKKIRQALNTLEEMSAILPGLAVVDASAEISSDKD